MLVVFTSVSDISKRHNRSDSLVTTFLFLTAKMLPDVPKLKIRERETYGPSISTEMTYLYLRHTEMIDKLKNSIRVHGCENILVIV